ncbi:DNA excision repair protein 4 [Heterostelium album PN500]|uniref:DNA excision repair protein 4 n=1 Tax=Heterostelium pallidum (strain ATCC 26659 / Pp 5 / PN500) TaxID=670386 RepID=D3B761_HETP5|nr:DNA excision repair protein 4 [Heterostelium album PN500]EFA82604.1 DNA excision repair protein 4 [Heterostelium album PN500]|eukprot:XP_020434721.1 DNA excision repair protein 4 [Heterostelium album PN500]
MDDTLFNSFDSMLHQQLKPIWGDINKQTKQTIGNIKVLRTLSTSLLAYDCITFLKLLESVAITEAEDENSWIHTETANTLFRHARERVYIQTKLNLNKKDKDKDNHSPNKKQKTTKDNKDKDKDDNNNNSEDESTTSTKNNNSDNNDNNNKQSQNIFKRELILEENPKWNLLLQVLEEIEDINRKRMDEPENVLVIVKDERTCQQLQDYLNIGGYDMLSNRYDRLYPPDRPTTMPPQQHQNNRFKYKKNNSNGSTSNSNRFSYRSKQINQSNRKQKISETNYRKKVEKDSAGNSLFSMGVSVISNGGNMFIPNPKIISDTVADYELENNFNADDLMDFYGILHSPHVVIHPLDQSLSILNELRPRFIVIYDLEISITRQIEVYQAENPAIQIGVYLLFYGESTEERKYLSVLNREKSSFEKLIREKANLVVDTSTHVDAAEAYKLLDPESSTRVDSRYGGIVRRSLIPTTNPKIIVDSHEFKSSLPVALHGAGYEIIPKRLTVADYVITPTLAAERKSVPDLIGSFQSGRLYAQIEAMGRIYRNPLLLIEYDIQQPFISLISPEELAYTTYPRFTLSSKLIMLCRSFPKLRVLWSRSAHSTVNIFRRLKELQPEPDPQNIDELTEESVAGNGEDSEYNYGPQDVLRKLPGITDLNIKRVMDGVQDLHELSKKSQEDLQQLLGSEEEAKQLFDFFNFTINDAKSQASSSNSSFTSSKPYYNNNNNNRKRASS